MLITALDETAWLFNMRGGDVSYNPIFVSYGIVTPKEASLFVDAAKACASPTPCWSLPGWRSMKVDDIIVLLGQRQVSDVIKR